MEDNNLKTFLGKITQINSLAKLKGFKHISNWIDRASQRKEISESEVYEYKEIINKYTEIITGEVTESILDEKDFRIVENLMYDLRESEVYDYDEKILDSYIETYITSYKMLDFFNNYKGFDLSEIKYFFYGNMKGNHDDIFPQLFSRLKKRFPNEVFTSYEDTENLMFLKLTKHFYLILKQSHYWSKINTKISIYLESFDKKALKYINSTSEEFYSKEQLFDEINFAELDNEEFSILSNILEQYYNFEFEEIVTYQDDDEYEDDFNDDINKIAEIILSKKYLDKFCNEVVKFRNQIESNNQFQIENILKDNITSIINIKDLLFIVSELS